ncbi:hypothetical protein WUBG_15307 [Wuchereria bancrofti]|uniref:Uncharacterized protein n=1 Tax=Wuchereria bancrofti TaxID=6293 RepID=J9DVM7_WUCBA|nr:hypothetical protein WUBG_15307 [Wuchereria bancrofti]
MGKYRFMGKICGAVGVTIIKINDDSLSERSELAVQCLNQCALSVMLISGSLTRNLVHVPSLHFWLSPGMDMSI